MTNNVAISFKPIDITLERDFDDIPKGSMNLKLVSFFKSKGLDVDKIDPMNYIAIMDIAKRQYPYTVMDLYRDKRGYNLLYRVEHQEGVKASINGDENSISFDTGIINDVDISIRLTYDQLEGLGLDLSHSLPELQLAVGMDIAEFVEDNLREINRRLEANIRSRINLKEINLVNTL